MMITARMPQNTSSGRSRLVTASCVWIGVALALVVGTAFWWALAVTAWRYWMGS